METRSLLLAAALVLTPVLLAPTASAELVVGVCAFGNQAAYRNAGPNVFLGVYAGPDGARAYSDANEFQRRCYA